jgi:hypothetical protein
LGIWCLARTWQEFEVRYERLGNSYCGHAAKGAV